MDYESILLIPVPAAETVVEQCRSKYDPSAADGIPAHITINYPFIPDKGDLELTVTKLDNLFSAFQAFDFSIASLDQFPSVLYLKPEPTEPFVELVEKVAELFPDSPPYEGKYQEINPHLTIAQIDNEQLLESVKSNFLANCGGKLPVMARADQVWLMDNLSGRWIRRKKLELKSKGQNEN